MKVKFVAEEKYRPKYANETDACMDLKAKITKNIVYRSNGEIDMDKSTLGDTIFIQPGETVKIDSGVQAAVPVGQVMEMRVRSSIGIKKNLCLANGTGIIDAGYRDNIIMALHNFGKEPVAIQDGDRVCQFLIRPFEKIEPQYVEDDEDFRNGDRGGGIGSTGVQ